MCHSSPEIIVCIKHNNIFHYCNKHKQDACENTSCGHKLLSACWCFSHLNSCRILSAQRASTRFTNLSPKSNKLPKHPSSRQPEREEKSWLSTSVFSFPSFVEHIGASGRHSSSTLPPSSASTSTSNTTTTTLLDVPLKLSETQVSTWRHITRDGSAAVLPLPQSPHQPYWMTFCLVVSEHRAHVVSCEFSRCSPP